MKLKEKDLNNYDFLILLGFKNAQEKDRERINSRLISLVWEEFLLEKLEKELGEQGIKEVNDMVSGNSKVSEVVDFITQKIPNLKDILQSILIKAKKDIIKEYYQQILEDTDQALFYPSISDVDKEIIRERKNKYILAKDLFEEEDWDQLIQLMSK